MILVNIGNKDVTLFKKTDEPKTYLFLWKIHYQNDQIISLRPTKWLARISVIYYFVVLYFFPETVFLFLNVSVQFIFIFSAGMYSIGRTDIAQKI